MRSFLTNQNIDYCQEIKQLIIEALDQEHLLKAIANRSVEHDNGFLKVVLRERTIASHGFRIHYWKPGTFDSNIHSHRWNMASIILEGGYHASEYEPFDNGIPYYFYSFKPQENDYLLELVDVVRLKEKKREYYSKWSSYELFRGDIHKILKVSDKGAMTAVISWGEDLQMASVYSESKIGKFESKQKVLSIDQVRQLLQRSLASVIDYLLNT
jgi:hypothetical protein